VRGEHLLGKTSAAAAAPNSLVRNFLGEYPTDMILGTQLQGKLKCWPKSLRLLKMLAWFFGQNTTTRVILPAIFYRISRCNDDDYMTMQYLASLFQHVAGSGSGNINNVIQANIGVSEMFSRKQPFPTAEALAAVSDNLMFASYTPSYFGKASVVWPVYKDPLVGKWYNNPEIPIIVLSGLLDPETNYYLALEAKNHLVLPFQGVVTFPYGVHGQVGTKCGLKVAISFMQVQSVDNTDVACIFQEPLPDFDGTTLQSKQLAKFLLNVSSFF